MSVEKHLTTAKTLALEASQIILKLRSEKIEQHRKKDHSLVTQADLAADRIIREGLSKAFPEHAILTEENGLSGREGSDWCWLIDPLDGTKAYAKGIAGFSVMIGLLKKGEPYLGVVVDPLKGLVYEAVRGQGAFLSPSPGLRPPSPARGEGIQLRVSTRNDFSQMPLVVSTGFPKEKLSSLREWV
ncbi:MAG: hypothetical protein HY073_03425, partial [Deltaproteobacteria bacterium]|nr:hypothetical protein [Deltaproteobacteria bacterium]